jgi:protein TonB
MTAQQILKADLLDLLFENRNKEYGAYVLRRDYPSHLKKAMGIMLLLVSALCLYVWSHPQKIIYVQRTIDLMPDPTISKLKEEKKQEKPKLQERKVEKAPPTQIKSNPVIVPDDKFKNPMPEVNDTADIAPGPINSPGTGGDNSYVSGTADPKPHITPVVEPTPPAEPAILENAEIDPEFPGGKEAWMNYLQRMLRVPDDMEEGERKTVRVKFVVNADGEVTDAVIIQSAGTSFDKEVLRVISRMPKWKPGKQRGRPVAVFFTQPVTFTAQSE